MFKNSNISLLLQHFRSVVGVFICLLIIRKLSIFIPMKQLNLIKNIKYHTIHRKYGKVEVLISKCFDSQKIISQKSSSQCIICISIQFLVSMIKYEEVSMCSLKSRDISSYGQRRNIFFFLKIVPWYGLNFFR